MNLLLFLGVSLPWCPVELKIPNILLWIFTVITSSSRDRSIL